MRKLHELPQKGLQQEGESRLTGRGLRISVCDTGGVAVSVPTVQQRRGHLGLRGCRLVALRQLEATEKANGCAEHGHFIQPGPAPKGGYSPRPSVAPNFATTGPDAHTPAHAAGLCATYMSSNVSCTSWVVGFSLRSIMPQVLDEPLRFAHLCVGIQQPPGRWEYQRAALPEGRADGRRRRAASTIRGAPYMHATARASWWWWAGVWRCSPTASISALPALLPLTGRW